MRGLVELFKAEVITGFAPTPLLSWGPIYWARVLPFSDPDSRREQPTGASARKLTEEKWAAEALKDAWNFQGSGVSSALGWKEQLAFCRQRFAFRP